MLSIFLPSTKNLLWLHQIKTVRVPDTCLPCRELGLNFFDFSYNSLLLFCWSNSSISAHSLAKYVLLSSRILFCSTAFSSHLRLLLFCLRASLTFSASSMASCEIHGFCCLCGFLPKHARAVSSQIFFISCHSSSELVSSVILSRRPSNWLLVAIQYSSAILVSLNTFGLYRIGGGGHSRIRALAINKMWQESLSALCKDVQSTIIH